MITGRSRPRLAFDVAITARDWGDVRELRDHAYLRNALTPSQWEEDRQLDAMGWVGLLRDGDQPVATIRGIPVTASRVELRDLGHLPAWADGDPGLCELGRLAALRRPRGVPYGVIAVLQAARWARRNTTLDRWIAYTSPALLRYCGAFGARDLGVRFTLPRRNDREYALITGGIARAGSMARLMGGNVAVRPPRSVLPKQEADAAARALVGTASTS